MGQATTLCPENPYESNAFTSRTCKEPGLTPIESDIPCRTQLFPLWWTIYSSVPDCPELEVKTIYSVCNIIISGGGGGPKVKFQGIVSGQCWVWMCVSVRSVLHSVWAADSGQWVEVGVEVDGGHRENKK